MTQLTENILVEEIPLYAVDPWIINNGKEAVGLAWYDPNRTFGGEELMWSESKQLPPGNYSFICTSLTANFGEAAQIVEKIPSIIRAICYKNYDESINRKSYLNPIESLHSLLRSKGLNSELNYAILRKQF